MPQRCREMRKEEQNKSYCNPKEEREQRELKEFEKKEDDKNK